MHSELCPNTDSDDFGGWSRRYQEWSMKVDGTARLLTVTGVANGNQGILSAP